MKSKNSERIKVAVRSRPISDKEKQEGFEKCVAVDIDRGEIIVKKTNENAEVPRNFFFDKVFDERCSQEQIFKETALPIVESVIQGYNGTIFAYGQTGTGKTFTMEGDLKQDEMKGIIPRSFELIFNLIKTTFKTNFLIRVSFLEIYNENIRDLLTKNESQKLEVRQNPESGFYVNGLSTFVVKSPQEMIELMERGLKLRVVSGHDMNLRSSRSHSIFTIIVDNSTRDENGEEHIRMGKLNLVDLAGSERQSKTGATGKNFQDAIGINLSLTALGKVIFALAGDKPTHIPYRDSNLTKLLQDSLGGNSKTVMIANIGPADYNYDETITTLRYASRAKEIKNIPKINEDPKDAMIRQYQDELNRLKKALAEQQGNTTDGNILREDGLISNDSKKKISEMEDKIQKEKEDILRQADREKKLIEDSKNHAEDEKLSLLDKLKLKKDEQVKQAKNKEKLIQKLKLLEEKFVLGEENEKKAKENEKIILKTKQELENQENKRLQLQIEIQKKAEEEEKIKTNFDDKLSEIKEKQKIYEKLKQKLQELENERDDINKEYDRGFADYIEFKKQIEKEINYKDTIINHLIPQKYLEWIENLMEFDINTGEWFIANLAMVGLGTKEIPSEVDASHILAMGFHDDEELFHHQHNMMKNDIQLSMMLEMNNPPKNVYFSYEDKKVKKGMSGKTRTSTSKGRSVKN